MLVHITQQDRLALIARHGLLSPAAAAEYGRPVFGSEDSNRNVVQLLDLRGVSRRIFCENIDALIDGALHNGWNVTRTELRVLLLDEALRDDPAFVPRDSVTHRCKTSGSYEPKFRHIAGLEAWYEGSLPHGWIREVLLLRDFETRLSDG